MLKINELLQFFQSGGNVSSLPVLGLQQALKVHEAHQEAFNVFGSAQKELEKTKTSFN